MEKHNQILVEDAHEVNYTVIEEMNESTGKTEKNYYVEGIFSTPGVKNRNGRIYPNHLWENALNKWRDKTKQDPKFTLGEMDHPPRIEPDPMKAVIKIQKLEMKDGYIYGKAKILNNNSNPEISQLKALIDEGFPIGISSRGHGRIGKGNIVEDFELSCYDLTHTPSDYNAKLKGIRESVEKDLKFDEEKNEWVCDDGECYLKESVNEDEKCCNGSVDTVIKALEDYASKPEIAKKEADEKALKAKFEEHFGKNNINEATPKGYIQRLIVTKNGKEFAVKPADWLDVHLYSREPTVTKIKVQYSKGGSGGVDLGKSTLFIKRSDGVWVRYKHQGRNTNDIVVFKTSGGLPYYELVGKA
jgi:hypothetical protein